MVYEVPAQGGEVVVERFEDAVDLCLAVVTLRLEPLGKPREQLCTVRAPAGHRGESAVGPDVSPEHRIVDRGALPVVASLHAMTIGAMERPEVPLRERLPDRVTIVEVGPRDGLQAEKVTVPTGEKVEFIARLVAAGHTVIEATSFVSPDAVPQLADAEELLRLLPPGESVRYPVLVPNERGLERALAAGVREIAVFVSVSESYSRKNLRRSRAEALAMAAPVVRRAKDTGLRVRGYLSMVVADPWDGPTPVGTAVSAGRALLDHGCDELSLGDTIGIGTPADVQRLIGAYLAAGVPADALAVHFHDTYGQGLANVLAALELGITTVDASAAGIGGSAFAKGAAGNLATEDLVWMLDGLGIETGVDVRKVAAAGTWMCERLGREPAGRVTRALSAVLET